MPGSQVGHPLGVGAERVDSRTGGAGSKEPVRRSHAMSPPLGRGSIPRLRAGVGRRGRALKLRGRRPFVRRDATRDIGVDHSGMDRSALARLLVDGGGGGRGDSRFGVAGRVDAPSREARVERDVAPSNHSWGRLRPLPGHLSASTRRRRSGRRRWWRSARSPASNGGASRGHATRADDRHFGTVG